MTYDEMYDDLLEMIPGLKYGVYAGVVLAVLIASKHFMSAITRIIIEWKKMQGAWYM